MMMTRKQFLGSLVGGMFGIAALASGCVKSDEGDDGTDSGGGSGSGDGSGSGGGGGSTEPDAGVGNPATPDGSVPVTCGTAAAAIGSNHGHQLAVSQADLDAGAEKTYSIKGSSAHNHTVVITAAMFQTLKTSRTLQATSTNDASHSHSVTVTC